MSLPPGSPPDSFLPALAQPQHSLIQHPYCQTADPLRPHAGLCFSFVSPTSFKVHRTQGMCIPNAYEGRLRDSWGPGTLAHHYPGRSELTGLASWPLRLEERVLWRESVDLGSGSSFSSNWGKE